MIERFVNVRLMFFCFLSVSLVFFGAAQDNSSVNESYGHLDSTENSFLNFEEVLNNSKSYIRDLRSFGNSYGINRVNLGISSIVVILAIILFFYFIPGKKDSLAEKEVIEDFDIFDDVPEAKEYENLKSRINQLESDVKNQEGDNEELLKKLGKANRLYSMNKVNEAEKLVNKVEEQL